MHCYYAALVAGRRACLVEKNRIKLQPGDQVIFEKKTVAAAAQDLYLYIADAECRRVCKLESEFSEVDMLDLLYYCRTGHTTSHGILREEVQYHLITGLRLNTILFD